MSTIFINKSRTFFINTSVLNLHDYLADKINKNGVVKGALQVVQLRPFCIVSFLESSVRLYDAIATDPNSVLSQNATGRIIKCLSSPTKQILYYELTIAHPNVVNEDALIPLTFMLSGSQSFYTVVQWLKAFKGGYRKVCRHQFLRKDEIMINITGKNFVCESESKKQFKRIFQQSYFSMYSIARFYRHRLGRDLVIVIILSFDKDLKKLIQLSCNESSTSTGDQISINPFDVKHVCEKLVQSKTYKDCQIEYQLFSKIIVHLSNHLFVSILMLTRSQSAYT